MFNRDLWGGGLIKTLIVLISKIYIPALSNSSDYYKWRVLELNAVLFLAHWPLSPSRTATGRDL